MQQRKFILECLKSLGINHDFKEEIDAMENEYKITPNTPLQVSKILFFLHMSSIEQYKNLFHSLLKNELPFDISFSVNKNNLTVSSKEEMESMLKGIVEYVYTEKRADYTFYGLKLKSDDKSCYDALKKIFVKPEDVIFFEHPVLFDSNEGVGSLFNELMFHLMSLDLPLSIIHYDLLYRYTNPLPIYRAYIYLEPSASWPSDDDAIMCAKTAFYCQMFKQSKYSVFIDKSFVTFKYKELYFSISIILESDKINPRNVIEQKVQNEIKVERKVVSKILAVKKVLMDIGVYPLLIDDLLIDSLALSMPKSIMGDGLFVKLFFSKIIKIHGLVFDINKRKLSKNQSKSTENYFVVMLNDDTIYNVPIPHKDVLDYILKATSLLRFWEGSVIDSKGNTLSLNLEIETRCCDFMLFIEPVELSKEIVGALCTDFDLGTPAFSLFLVQDIMKDIKTIYYSPTHQTLGVKVKPGVLPDLVANILISRTSFRYVSFFTS